MASFENRSDYSDYPQVAPGTMKVIEEMYESQERRSKGAPGNRGAGEFLRTLPVIFVVLIIIFVYSIYIMFHLIPLLQYESSSEQKDKGMFARGILEAVVFHMLFPLFFITYILSIITPPGSIPDTPEWISKEPLLYNETNCQYETKKEGDRRYCKWCMKFKPDRSHHCRQCRRCVLKMDHHCPWIYNCVGWGNHKYFILTLIFSSLTSLFVFITQLESVKAAVEEPFIEFGVFMVLLLSEVFTGILALVSTLFLFFHLWLVFQNLSTIEFCEKHIKKTGTQNVYNRGCLKNLKDSLGPNPLLWLLPIDNRRGDGVHFPTDPDSISLLKLCLTSKEDLAATRKSKEEGDEKENTLKQLSLYGHPLV